MALDTSSVNMTLAELKATLAQWKLEHTKTPEEINALILMYEAKWARINALIDGGTLTTAERVALAAKKLRMLRKYYILKKWLEGVRP